MEHTCCYSRAVAEGVASVAGVAGAGWVVVLGPARSELSTDPRTGVHALVPHTCFVCWTLRIDGTLRFALDVRVALEAWKTGARGRLIPFPAFCVNATGRWVAGVDYLRPGASSCRGNGVIK